MILGRAQLNMLYYIGFLAVNCFLAFPNVLDLICDSKMIVVVGISYNKYIGSPEFVVSVLGMLGNDTLPLNVDRVSMVQLSILSLSVCTWN